MIDKVLEGFFGLAWLVCTIICVLLAATGQVLAPIFFGLAAAVSVFGWWKVA